MRLEVQVRSARLEDSPAIADFINAARPNGAPVTPSAVIERFSNVGFLLAEQRGRIVGLLGWQVENLIVRVTDFLIAPAMDRLVAGRALITKMEEQGCSLQAEVTILFLPPALSKDLIEYWEFFGYQHCPVVDMPRQWRAAVQEWNSQVTSVMIKRLRTSLVGRPI
ncbi:MAG: hypothetical protein DRI37_09995 [Chloroflexi bacterium]|nr:MAG: hypothetical protein DRI37_09995 [Chloroflexota bacterium]